MLNKIVMLLKRHSVKVGKDHNVEKVTKEDEGNFKVGSSAVIIQKGLPPTRWTCKTLEDSTIFSWVGSAYGIKMKATHILEDKFSGVSNKLVKEAKGL